MSCLYSSPELLPWIILNAPRLNCRESLRRAFMRTEPRCRPNPFRVCQPSRSTNDASPTAGAHRQRTNSITLPKQANLIAQGFCCVSLQAQYQAFVHVAVESGTAIALEWTCVLEPFNRRAFRCWTLPASTRGQRPWTDVVAGT